MAFIELTLVICFPFAHHDKCGSGIPPILLHVKMNLLPSLIGSNSLAKVVLREFKVIMGLPGGTVNIFCY